MRIGGGPRLRIPRTVRSTLGGYWRRHAEHLYNEALAERRAQIRKLPSSPAGDRKRPTRYARSVPVGCSYRFVNSHGREYGKRHTATEQDPTDCARVRLVDRQEEHLWSAFSRMLKAAHRAYVRSI